MEISEEKELALLAQPREHLLGVVHHRRQPFRGLLPHAVQVETCKTAAVVATHNAVRVERGNELEDELVDEESES